MEHCPKLTPRLQAVADMISQCDTLADIGTDHAYLPVYLIRQNKIKRAIASDIRKGPVLRAQNTINRYCAADRIQTRLGAGMTTLTKGEADVIVIAGMGGILIADILAASADLIGSDTVLILQPMIAMYELREYLNKSGLCIADEVLAKEDRKLYHIMRVCRGEEGHQSLTELYFGKHLLEVKPKHFDEYLDGRRHALSVAADGMEKSKTNTSKQKLSEYRYLIDQIDKIKKGEIYRA